MKDDSTTKHTSALPFPNEFTMLMLPLQMRPIPPFLIKTRPDTRPPVADGWAGAELCVFPLNQYGPMDGPTDGRTDKASFRVACPQPKRKDRRSRLDASLATKSLKVQINFLLKTSPRGQQSRASGNDKRAKTCQNVKKC